jgi:dTDP-4-amino-4,6-dideoxygalactose transaminase
MSNPASIPVPLFDAKIQYKALHVNLEEAVKRVLASGQAIGGPEVEGLEQEIATYCGAAQAVACASGTDAISLALAALGIKAGDEVIVPPFTFFASAACVSRLGAKPVFVDIEPDTFNLDVHQVENKITPRTKAIMPVHLFGQSVDMEPLWHIAERHNLPLIEDAAQAIGTEYQGKRTGTLGAMACFSFYPTKNLGAYGDGGMVVTNDYEWAEKIRWLRNHGMKKRYYHEYMGWNSRLDAVQAALLRVKLQYLNLWIEARRAIAQRYHTMIDEHQLGHFLTKPVVKSFGKHTFNQYTVRVKNNQRDALREWLKADQIGTEIYYPVPLHLQKVYADLGHEKGDFPATEQACREVLSLPIFPELTIEQQRRVMSSCANFLRQQVRLAA